jgi:uncharacterized protein
MPHPIRIIENQFIPMADGMRLAARLWLPEDAEQNPVPAILEAVPYRKRDGTRARDEAMHGWFARQGYACIRLDLRGSGDSEGLLDDEYSQSEQDDLVTVIAWLAAQPWCDGKVGMIGISWGGFNALQAAARRPPALKAVITVCSTDDRYADDVHFMGGCLLNDNLWWGTAVMAWQALPPTPAFHPQRWRDIWRVRIEALPFLPALWASHSRRDAYWRHGSVCEDWSAITVPVFAVGGWADSYVSAVGRLLEHLDVPRLGLIGPWAHRYPHEGKPGPAIDFLREAKRWWDHWLKGEDSGIMAEPMLRAFVGEPGGTGGDAAGRWVGEASWPSRLVTRRPMFLAPGQLWWRPGPAADLSVRSPLWCGSTAGEWMSTGVEGEAPLDQRLDDGLSLVFESKELADRTEILGVPELVLELACDSPTAQLCVRLSDVAPDGSATRITWQILNLTHRRGHADPVPIEPGAFEIVRVKLRDCGHAFLAGHRIRLSISTAAWPTVWPAQDQPTITVRTGESALILPVRRPRREDWGLRLGAAEPARPSAKALAAPVIERRFGFDVLSGAANYVTDGDAFGEPHVLMEDIGTEFAHRIRRDLSIRDGDVDSARQEVAHAVLLACDGRRFRVALKGAMVASRDAFRLAATLRAYEDDRLFAERSFAELIPRDLA